MPGSQQLLQDLRRHVVDTHQAGKACKNISKDPVVQQSLMGQTVYKWRKLRADAALPWSKRPARITARAQQAIGKELKEKEPLGKDNKMKLKGPLKSCEHYQKKTTLMRNSVRGRGTKESKKKNNNLAPHFKLAQKIHKDVLQCFCKQQVFYKDLQYRCLIGIHSTDA